MEPARLTRDEQRVHERREHRVGRIGSCCFSDIVRNGEEGDKTRKGGEETYR